MADNNYGVYVSIRTPSGLLWSSSRETAVEVQADITDVFGEEFYDSFVRQVLGEPEVKSTLGGVTEEEAVANVTEIFQSKPDGEDDGQPTFEKCEICGSLKDKWTPPGVSKKTGKAYKGFFGCNNFQNHRR